MSLVPVNDKVDKFLNNLPDIPVWVCKSIYDIGLALLRDDAHDIGYFQYYNRKGVYYHGKKSVNHHSPIHHWQPALFMIIIAQIGGLLAKTKELYSEFVEIDKMFDEDEIDEGKIIKVDYKVIEEKTELVKKIPTVFY